MTSQEKQGKLREQGGNFLGGDRLPLSLDIEKTRRFVLRLLAPRHKSDSLATHIPLPEGMELAPPAPNKDCLGLVAPERSPLAPLKKGGTGISMPPFLRGVGGIIPKPPNSWGVGGIIPKPPFLRGVEGIKPAPNCIDIAPPPLLPLLSSLTLLLGGGLLLAHPAIAKPKPLPPPTIFDNLPPPQLPQSQPNIPPPSAPVQVPSLPPGNRLPSSRDLQFDAPPPESFIPRRNVPAGAMYEVDVSGDSPLLFAQVQRIVPDAFVRRKDGIIQAGLFAEQSYAVERVRLLEAQGIRAEIKTVAARTGNSPTVASDAPIAAIDSPRLASDAPTAPSEPPRVPTSTPTAPSQPATAPSEPPPVTSEPPPVTPSSRSRVNYYYVVIPGARENLANMASEVLRSGINRDAVQLKEGPRGPHLAIGPFEKRALAERWSNYFRSAGMDARVYFGR